MLCFTSTNFEVDGSTDLIIDQLNLGWTPNYVVVGIGPTDGQPMDGMSLIIDEGAPISLSGWWQQEKIPFTSQSEISLTVTSFSSRQMRIQWWATN